MMTTQQQAHSLMRALGMSLGIELVPDADGAVGIRVDDRLDLTLRYEASPPGLLAYCAVGTLPQGAIAGIMRSLLEANHVWEGSRGATWSLSGDEVVLSRMFALQDLDGAVLLADLAVFVDLAAAGQRMLEGTAAPMPAGIQHGPPGLLPMGMMTV